MSKYVPALHPPGVPVICMNTAPPFPLSQDVAWFLKEMKPLVQEEMGVASVPQEPFFVDFLREAPEPTGEEPEDADLEAPKVYEQVGQV